MTFADKLSTIAENEQKVFDAGKQEIIDNSKYIPKTANGNPLAITDASEIPHVVGVKVVNKKNLFNPNAAEVVYTNGNIYTEINTNSISLTLSQGDFGFVLVDIGAVNDFVGKTLTLSAKQDTSFNWGSTMFVSCDANGGNRKQLGNNNFGKGNSATATITAEDVERRLTVRLYISECEPNTTYEFKDFQIEIGSTATDYVGYNSLAVGTKVTLTENGNTYTTDSNGEFECESLCPNMTFTCDDVVDIEADYWKSYGMQTEYDRFWNNFRYVLNIENGKIVERTHYENAFFMWGLFEFIEPPYKIVPTSRDIEMFNTCTSLKEIRKQYFDLSQCQCGTSGSTQGHYATFRACINLEIIEDIGLKPGYCYATFWHCHKLKTIEKIRTNVDCIFSSTFSYCYELQNITFEGEIGKNIEFTQSPKLTTASLLSILTALSKDSTYASGKTLTLNSASKAVIEADSACSEQLTNAVSAGWAIAYA